jgi:hypothetical protein
VADLDGFERLVRMESGLSVVSVHRPDGSIHSSVVNAGVLRHPVTNLRVVGFVAVGGAAKLRYLRVWPSATIVVRSGWDWVAVEGETDLFGPDDPGGLNSWDQRDLLRTVFSAAGGTHDDWYAYDKAMVEDARTAVLVPPQRVYSNRSA